VAEIVGIEMAQPDDSAPTAMKPFAGSAQKGKANGGGAQGEYSVAQDGRRLAQWQSPVCATNRTNTRQFRDPRCSGGIPWRE